MIETHYKTDTKAMKKLTLSILTLCTTLMVSAEPIGKQAALYTAQAYMLAKGKNISEAQKPFKAPRKGAAAQTEETEDAYYYVFNAGNDNGYIIVSGDDRTEPVLGYVEHGTFDINNIPENMRSWLQLYADQIKYIIDNDIQPDSPLLRKRNKIQGTRHSIGELLTTRWNQGHPYNITCPKYYKGDGSTDYPATGCTATAMAQVMNFYKFPEKTKANIPALTNTYTLDNGTQKTSTAPMVPRNTKIDWENMRDTYDWPNGHVANAQDSAVANLMLYCGQSVNMGYGPQSGANFSAEAYVNYFGFASGAYVGSRSDYSIDDWFNLLYNELDQGYPVLFSGFSSGGGHAFVIDGFDGEDLFHLNWGWGGGSNGWFLVGILNPGDTSGIGASSSSDGYSMSQRALFNLRTPGTPKADAYLSISDVSMTTSTIKAKYTNRTGASGSFNVGIVKLEDDGSLTLVGTKSSITGMANGSSQTKTFSLTNKLPEGTYRLSPASKPARSEEWQAAYDMQTQYIEAEVDSTGAISMQFHKPVLTGESLSIDTIVFPGTRIVGKQQEVKVTFRNNGAEYYKEIHFFASKTNQKVYTNTRSIVAVRSGETVDVSYYFTPAETGTYNLWFCTNNNGSGEVGRGTMEVITEAEASKGNLTVSAYNITNAVNGVLYGNALVGKATIRNNRNVEFHGRIRFQLWNQPSGSNVAWSGPASTHEIDIAANKSVSVDFSFDGLSENNKYYIATSYVDQDGSLTNGGVWDLGGWDMKAGIAIWKADGTLSGKAHSTTLSTASTTCAVYANCSKTINRMMPNRNPNTIYAFGANMTIPERLDTSNVVHGIHADNIRLHNDYAFVIPATFRADSASYAYHFPETGTTGWAAITMPFRVDSIFLDDEPVALDDTLKHFWIYEFSSENTNGEPVFKPATKLYGGTPYLIAGDAQMAGRTLCFRSLDVPFFKTGTDKMVVTSTNFQFHGNTYSPKVKDCYVLNEEGTAFEYTTVNKTLTPMASYFTSKASDEETPASIVLPDIPVAPVLDMTLDESSYEPIASGTYDRLTLRRTFEAGWNTFCLPFEIDNVEELFGEGAQAYEFYGTDGNEFSFCPAIGTLEAGKPYIINLTDAIQEDIILAGISIAEENTTSGKTSRSNSDFCGTYTPLASGQWPAQWESTVFYTLNPDGTVTRTNGENDLNGFRAYFELKNDIEVIAIHIYDSPDGIGEIAREKQSDIRWYNLAGQRIGTAATGVSITNGKKVLQKRR